MGARMNLKHDPNIADADGLYAAIIEAHSGLSPDDSMALNARLVLLLANQVGDPQVLLACIAEAREQGRRRP